jgi:SulP family sulfate permease
MNFMRLSDHSVSFWPFREEFRSYCWGFFRQDGLAALAVALLTIPQSIAYSLLAGLPPTAGLFSAIFGTIFTATFCSSRHLISGPSTGIAILIQTAVSDVLYNYFEMVTGPARDILILHILGQIVLIMGVFQIGSAFFNVSRLLQFVSRTVMLGYFAGIMMALIINQSFYFFGIPPHYGQEVTVLLKGLYILRKLNQIDWITALIGTISLVLLLILRKQKKELPDALIVLITASALSLCLSSYLHKPATAVLGDFGVLATPFPQITWPLLDFKLISKIFPSAAAIAMLAILEVFSISRNFAARSGQNVQTNQDIFGLGAGNISLSLLSGAMPASGSATRTALNYRFRAQTRLAAILSGLFTAVIVIFCWPLVQLIPLAALAALLFAIVPTLVDFREVQLAIRATREDCWVFFLTLTACLIFTLDIAFFIGISISIANYLRRSAIPHLVEYAFNSKGRLAIVNPKEDVHRKVRIIGIGGDLYFASANVFQESLQEIAQDPNVAVIVLRLTNVYHMDASMCLAIQRLHEALLASQRHLLISGVTDEVWHVFHRAGLACQIGLDNFYFTDESNPQFSTWKACLRAQDLIHCSLARVRQM